MRHRVFMARPKYPQSAKTTKKHNWRIVSACAHSYAPTRTTWHALTSACTHALSNKQTYVGAQQKSLAGYLEKSNFIWNSKNLNAENKSKTLATAATLTTATTTTTSTITMTTATTTTMMTITTTSKEQNESHKKQFKNLGQFLSVHEIVDRWSTKHELLMLDGSLFAEQATVKEAKKLE